MLFERVNTISRYTACTKIRQLMFYLYEHKQLAHIAITKIRMLMFCLNEKMTCLQQDSLLSVLSDQANKCLNQDALMNALNVCYRGKSWEIFVLEIQSVVPLRVI